MKSLWVWKQSVSSVVLPLTSVTTASCLVSLRWNINNTNQIRPPLQSPPIHSNRAYVSQQGGRGCVHVCVCVWGGDHTVYTLSRSGIVILTDVIESNEIGVSQRASTVSNAWSQCETALRTAWRQRGTNIRNLFTNPDHFLSFLPFIFRPADAVTLIP